MKEQAGPGIRGDDEFEATLVVCSGNPQEVIAAIEGLTSVSTYGLIRAGPRLIHDLYFDTDGYALDERKIGLRIREAGGERLLTLKGPARLTDWGAMRRLEIEGPWSEETVERVLEELGRMNAGIAGKMPDFNRLDCLDLMRRLGLGVIQERETHRRVRKIVAGDGDSGVELAELDIDTSSYHFGGRKVRHHEIEIEAKSKEGCPVVRIVHEGIIGKFGAGLRVWRHDKLATGRAIEELLGGVALEGLIDDYDNLKPGAYDVLAGHLERDGA